MKHILYILCIIPLFLSSPKGLNAQAYTLSVAPVSVAEYPNFEPYLNQAILEVCVQSKRFAIKDWAGIEAMYGVSENAYQMLAEAGLSHVILPELTQLKIEEKPVEKDGEISSMRYTCRLGLTVKVVDLAAQTISVSENLQEQSTETHNNGSPSSQLVQRTITYMQKSVDRFIDKHFPGMYPILEVLEEKKGSAHVLLVAAGTAQGVSKGDLFDLVELKQYQVNGQTLLRKMELGSAVVTLVEGDNFAHCKVKSQDKDVKTLLQSGNTLHIVTRPREGIGAKFLDKASLNPFKP